MNRFSRVMLLIPGYPESHYFSRPLQAGLGYISETLNRDEIENIVVDMRFNHSLKNLFDKIETFKPDVVGVSMMTFKYRHSYSLLTAVKNKFPGVSIVAGGPHISTLREEVLRECDAIDFGVVLEGEEAILELCRGENYEDIKGLIYRDDCDLRFTGERKFVKDLDAIPFPFYKNFELDQYDNFIPIISSRGCPYSCIYCPVGLAIGRKYRLRSPENIISEIRFWYEKGFRRFGFADDNFTLIPQRVEQLCRMIKEENLNGLNLSCSNGIRADRVDFSLLKLMREAGFTELAFGVEAGNDRILKRLKKSESIESIKRSIGDACQLGFDVNLFFLIGSPGETLSDIHDSVALAKSFPVVGAVFYNLIPFPNTELYKWVDDNNLFVKNRTEYLNSASHFINEPIFATPEFSIEERREALAMANREVKRHCKRNKALSVQRKIESSFGLRGVSSVYLSKIWCSDLIQNRVLSHRAVRKIKDRLIA